MESLWVDAVTGWGSGGWGTTEPWGGGAGAAISTPFSFQIEVAFGVDPLTTPGFGDWIDVTNYCRGFQIDRGRQQELDRTQAGTATVFLRNAAREFDPANASSPFAPNVVPMRRLRIRAVVGGGTYDLYQGFVQDWGQQWNPRPIYQVGEAVAAVKCSDAFLIYTLHTLTTYSAEVLADSPLSYWRMNDPVPQTSVADSGSESVSGTLVGGAHVGGAGPLVGGQTALVLDGSSGYVDVGVQPDLDLITDVTVEAWVKPSALNSNSTIVATDDAGPSGGRYSMFVLSTGAVAFVQRFANFQRQWTSPALAVTVGAWTHVVAIRQAGVVSMYVNGVAVPVTTTLIGGIFTAPSPHIYIGGPPTLPIYLWPGELAHVAIYDYALPAGRIAAHYAAPMDTFVSSQSGTVISAILDVIGWPTGERLVDAGTSLLHSFDPSGSALDVMLAVAEDTENGRLVMAGDGRVIFHSRGTLHSSDHIAAQAKFTDDPAFVGSTTDTAIYDNTNGLTRGGAYADGVVTNDDQWLYGKVEIQRSGGGEMVASDSASITRYGPRVLSRTGTLDASDNDSQAAAQYFLGRYKDPHPRPSQMVLRAGTNASITQQMASREVHNDRVLFERHPPGSGTISLGAAIQGVHHVVNAHFDWTTTWDLVPVDDQTYWILEDAAFGQLEVSTRLAY